MTETGSSGQRRQVRFDSLADWRSDVQDLAARPTCCLGHFSEGQIFDHLARAVDGALDGTLRAGFVLRLIGPLLKNRVVRGPIKPGFKLPARMQGELFSTAEISKQEGLELLLPRIERLEQLHEACRHPIFGQMSAEEMVQFQLRHAEMHLSFIVDA